MTSGFTDDDALRAKYMHRFRQHDTDGDGYVTAEDFRTRAARLVRGLGVPDDEPRARALHAGARHMWEGLVALADVEAGALSEAAFVAALTRARAEGGIPELVGPSVAAHLALIDTDGDGAVSLGEFTAGQVAMGQSESGAAEAFAALDTDGDGVLSTAEWHAAVLDFYAGPPSRTPGDLVLDHRP
ncbi:EF-hand domain-containing protein [Streptomyces sp. NPDC048172]|uniref:EF-hand domain-containing protein n=1 Tax=Streptomyces sp. NPDC048172 TaxID=3365505 RepID=UPI00371D3246